MSVLVILLLIKFPFSSIPLPILLPEIEWLEVGERLNSGSFLYKELWTGTAPLTALFYKLIYAFFARDLIYYQIFAIVLVYFQALYITLILNIRNVFLERNYVPALIYIVLMSVSFDLSKPSPNLLATTFVLLTIGGIIKQLDNRSGVTDEVFEIGLFLGLGSLFYLPTSIYMFWALLTLIAFTGVNIRQIFLVLVGFFLPLIIVWIYFYLNDSLNEFNNQWFLSILTIRDFYLNDFYHLILVYSIPVILSIFGVLRLLQIGRYSNFQTRVQQAMMLFGIFSLVQMIFASNAASYQFVSAIPFMAFFVTGFFNHLKGAYLPEIIFLSFLVSVFFIQIQGYRPFLGRGYKHLSEMQVDTRDILPDFNDKTILITGNRNDEYLVGKSATRYLNWDLAKSELQNPDTYLAVVRIFDDFKKDPPEYIIDKAEVFPVIFKLIPAVSKMYIPTNVKNIYKKR